MLESQLQRAWSPPSSCLSWKVCAYLLQCSIPVSNSIIIPEILQLWKNTGTFSSSCLSHCVILIWYIYTAQLFLKISICVLLWDTETQSQISVFNRSQKNAVDWWGERWWEKSIPTYCKKFKNCSYGSGTEKTTERLRSVESSSGVSSPYSTERWVIVHEHMNMW